MDYKILVPSGIGDFSWLWSKISTTDHGFHVEYIGGYPDRQAAFLKLLPKEKLLSFKPNQDYFTKWEGAALVCVPRYPHRIPAIKKSYRLSDLSETELTFFECNSFLESGSRLEEWCQNEIPETDFHYPMEGKLTEPIQKSDTFIVNFSSYGTKKAWGYYEVPDAAALVALVAARTKLTPIFIGGEYDDFTRDVFQHLHSVYPSAVCLVGKTPDLTEVIALMQRSRLYFGACSGLMVLCNNLEVPVITYYPPFLTPPGRHLSGAWHDSSIPYLGLFWDGLAADLQKIEEFLACNGGLFSCR